MSFSTVPAEAGTRNPFKSLAIWAVLFVSRFFRYFGSSCRFHPSCSQYSIQAFGRFGFFKASGLTVLRLFRCHPFHPGGHDPL